MTKKGKGPRRIPRSIRGTSGMSNVMRQSMRYKPPPIINQPRKSRADLSFMPVGVRMPLGVSLNSEQGQYHLSLSMQSYLRRFSSRPLTVKLRGRPQAPPKRRGRILSSRARGAEPLTVHGPLQRLLDRTRPISRTPHNVGPPFQCDHQLAPTSIPPRRRCFWSESTQTKLLHES
jgi:hypothetical protein